MNIITGKEKSSDSKIQSVINFYNAFNSKDIIKMKDVWGDFPEISMANPIGGIRKGVSEIFEGYDRIFNSNAEVYVEFYDFQITSDENMFLIFGKERGTFKKGDIAVDLNIRTSRTFIKKENKWLQLHHHGSIDNPELLASYQNAVKK